MEHASTIRPEDLLSHMSWARALARQLVRDDATADDVVQDSMAAALQSPPAADRPLRPWLARVVGNAARQRARGEGRRGVREREAAREEGLPSAAQLTERAEAQRLLIDALLALDEASREVVLLRYYEDLSSAEIARRTGEPAATVRSRLKRALDRLKDTLDERVEGGRGAWRTALAPLALPRLAGPAKVATGAGLWAVFAKGALLVGAASLVAVLLAAMLGGGLGSLLHVPVEDVEFVPLAERPEVEPMRPEAVLVERVEAADVGVDSPPAARPSRYGQVLLRFVEEDGTPVAGVVARGGRDSVAVSDAAGRVEVDVWFGSPRSRARVEVSCPGYAADVVELAGAAGVTTDGGDHVLCRGGALSGIVVDEAGAPLAGMVISVDGELRHESSARGLRMYATTSLGAADAVSGADGRFRLPGVLAGEVRVDVKSEDDLREGRSGRVEIRAGEESTGLVLTAAVIDAERRIEGIVLDAGGEPVPRARLSSQWSTLFMGGSSSTLADEQGRFRLLVASGARADLEATTLGFDGGMARIEGVRGGTHDVVLRLADGPALNVVVRAANGRPVPSARVIASIESGAAKTGETDESGRAVLSAPPGEFHVEVEAEGHLVGRAGPFTPEALPAELRIDLESAPVLRGVVIAEGAPFQGATVTLRAAATRRVLVGGLPSLVKPGVLESATTDSDGAFALTLRNGGALFLRCEAEGFAPYTLGPLTRAAASAASEPLTVALEPGGSLEGRVLDGDQVRQVRHVLLSRGDGVPFTVTTDPDGVFRVAHLTPGPWMIRLNPGEVRPGHAGSSSTTGAPFTEIPADCSIVSGRTTTHDLAVGDLAPRASLSGRLLLDGVDPTHFEVTLASEAVSPDQGGARRPRRIGPDGAFRFEGVAPGTTALQIVDTRDGDEDALRIAIELELLAGSNERIVELSFGQVSAGAAANRATERLLWRGPDGAFGIATLPPAGTSRSFPAGEVARIDARSTDFERLDEADVLERIELAPGETAVLAR